MLKDINKNIPFLFSRESLFSFAIILVMAAISVTAKPAQAQEINEDAWTNADNPTGSTTLQEKEKLPVSGTLNNSNFDRVAYNRWQDVVALRRIMNIISTHQKGVPFLSIKNPRHLVYYIEAIIINEDVLTFYNTFGELIFEIKINKKEVIKKINTLIKSTHGITTKRLVFDPSIFPTTVDKGMTSGKIMYSQEQIDGPYTPPVGHYDPKMGLFKYELRPN